MRWSQCPPGTGCKIFSIALQLINRDGVTIIINKFTPINNFIEDENLYLKSFT